MEEFQKEMRRYGISAESNDGYSISYIKNNGSENLYAAAKVFLPPELLYKGV